MSKEKTQATAHSTKATPPPINLQRACACGKHTDAGGECAECAQKRAQGLLQRAAIAQAPDVAPPIVHDVLRAPGQPLDDATRDAMEPRFGQDFGDVRVHTDAQAAASADAVQAQAYTVGNHVAFGDGQYQPGSSAGQRLLAHELAHVVQQGEQATSAHLRVEPAASVSEHAADQAAQRVASGEAIGSIGTAQPTLHRKPQRKMMRANRFLPDERKKLRALGRGELNELIDQIIADGAFHTVHKELIDGVEHTWEVKTEIIELSEEEQYRGAAFGGAIAPEQTVTTPDGKAMRHQETFILRGGQASSLETALHELIHLRIMIDRRLPAEKRSSFFNEYAQLNEMTEVLPSATFGKRDSTDSKASYGALPIVSGLWEREKVVLTKIGALRSFYINKDASAEAAFDADPELTPAAVIEFLTQEKYVSQTATKAATKHERSNNTVARLYARALASKFQAHLSNATKEILGKSPVGSRMLADATDELRLAIERMYEMIDQLLAQSASFSQNRPAPPANMPDPKSFESPPLNIGGEPTKPKAQ